MICKPTAFVMTALLAAGACVTEPSEAPFSVDDPASAGEPATSETTQGLSVFSWGSPLTFSGSGLGAQAVTYGTRTIVVAHDVNGNLSWRERLGAGSWTAAQAIAGPRTSYRVSLAAFNGYLYMLRSDGSTERLLLSRFDLGSSTWSAPVMIPLTSHPGPPAMAAFKGALHLIGTQKDSHQLWQATMSTAEVLSLATPMAGHYSNSRVSAAVLGCNLYIAHRGGATADVVYNFFNGSAWSYDRTIPAGPGGSPVQAWEPAIAERSNTLHLVYRTPTSDALMWTYLSNGSWPLALSVGTTRSANAPSLASSPDGLISTILTGNTTQSYRVAAIEYAQAYRQPVPCDVLPPIGF